jgi:hypothetical protein
MRGTLTTAIATPVAPGIRKKSTRRFIERCADIISFE